MSVTLWMPQAHVARSYPYDFEPDYAVVDPIEPFLELNLANDNFMSFMPVLLPTWDREWAGTLSMDDCATIYRNAFAMRNRAKLAATMLSPDVQDRNILYCGRDEEYVNARLDQFMKLCMVARANDFEVCYG